jgi:hypothetical protein
MKANYNVDNSDIELLKHLAQKYLNITFKGKQCVEHRSINIFRTNRGEFGINNRNSKFNLPTFFNASGLIYLFNDRSPLDYTPKSESAKTKEQKKKRPKPTYYTKRDSVLLYEHYAKKCGVSSETLERFNVRQVKTLFFKEDFCIEFQGVKYKRPKPKDKKYKYLNYSNSKEYCFGYNALPKSGRIALIVGGEDDALCINEHFNKRGIFAVCFSSENTEPIEHIMSDLKERFDRVIFLYDFDDTGAKFSELWAKKYKCEYIETAFFKELLIDALKDELINREIESDSFEATMSELNELDILKLERAKDLCDLYQVSRDFLVSFVRSCEHFSKRLESDSVDKFSVEVPNYLSFDIEQYLSNDDIAMSALNSALKTYKRVIMSSVAGSGKSTMLGRLKDDIKANDLEGIICFTPTISITEQLGKSLGWCALYGKCESSDIKTAKESKNVVLTFDKSMQDSKTITELSHWLKSIDTSKYLIVVDEYHQLVNDFDYRSGAMRAIFSLVESAKNCLLMSATPNLLFTCSEIYSSFDYKYIRFNSKVTNKIKVQVIEHSSSRSEILGKCLDFVPKDRKGVHCIKYDNNNALDAYKRVHESSYNIEHITSKEDSKSINNEVYKSIMNSGFLPKNKNLDVLLHTTIFESGVSFKFNVASVSVLDTKSTSKFIQQVTRARMNSANNKEVFVNWFYKKPTSEIEQYAQSVSEQFESAYKNAQLWCNSFNDFKYLENEKTDKVSTDIERNIYDVEGIYRVDILRILSKLSERENKIITPQILERRVKRLDNRFEFLGVQNTDALDERVKSELKDIRESKKECNARLENLVSEHLRDIMCATYTKSKDRHLRSEIKRSLKVLTIDNNKSIDFIIDNKECFATRLHYKIVRSACKLIKKGYSLKRVSNILAQNSAKDAQLKIDILNIKERKKRKRNGTINKQDLHQLAIYDRIKKRFKDIAKKQRVNKRAPLSREKIAEYINNVLLSFGVLTSPLSEKSAISYLERCYNLKRIRSKKGVLFVLSGTKKYNEI